MTRDYDGDNSEKAPDHLLAAAGLEDSDADDDMVSICLAAFLVETYKC